MREYLLAMTVALAVTLLLGGPVRALAIRLGLVPEIRERDAHKTPTPRVGGLAMFVGLAAALTAAEHFPMLERNVYGQSSTIQALLWGAFLVVVLGMVDDKFELDPLTKFAGQIFAASVMVVKGIQISWLVIPGIGIVAVDPTLSIVLSVFLVLALMNAVNFVDGLDGLAAGITCIAGLASFAYCYRLAISYKLTGATAPALISIVTVGICLGFLAHNWSPARMFMGDTGSMLLGMLLAASSITIMGGIDPYQLGTEINETVNQTSSVHKLVPAYLPLIMPVSVTLLPIADMVMAVVRRTKAGMSPLAADKGHLHHRMLQIGHSPRRAVLIMYFWSLLVAFVTVLFAVTPSRQPIVYLAIGMTLVGLVLLLGPRLGDHRDRLRDKALRVGSPPTARHRASAGGNGAEGAVSQGSAVEAAIPGIAKSTENAADGTDIADPDGGLRQRTLSR
ncbi:undecaprenyl/decaprenyl-phosphate alpha-N-acetylglucosaminyl 1-phosphate transferase [Catenulispora sp. NF23]|uniref:Undecaprenyl/decaprenyl-phosphate alpha-N-acetylglucosaminyl 1-phosphate transferase n=1 Tax=Catenulispora pinistramenti TaxID=2705254 RepID=A0ABS5KYH7_9ACTN|nr:MULTISPECIES: MraY family glycosyltransferase [Catenulispora]MBS2534675.1 undecaprenyl/decaprenyl-phosphate alpha-N-acetylglucosaminyl 1-phosphate transferase [Catenulispora pinistramenti]MBS2551072.1 undecaprenyl/decaprenyl-phosphate alpha-N-acetylglucosaminyl 1-phosphate transferase [Catenulispora pinistramenti]